MSDYSIDRLPIYARVRVQLGDSVKTGKLYDGPDERGDPVRVLIGNQVHNVPAVDVRRPMR